MMKHKINLLLLVAGVFFIFTSKADQITITFTNPVPAAPVNCGDTWSEQGIDMEISNSCNGLNCGNGNLGLNWGTLRVDLSDLGIVHKVSVSFLVGCCMYFKFTDGTTILEQESECYTHQSFNLYEFTNDNHEWIEYFEISPDECNGTTLLDITFDYTPICESEPISNVRNGDVYLDDACYGVIMTSPSGNCFRAKVADNGMLFTELVECP